MYLCHCFGLSSDNYDDAVEDLALKIIGAPDRASAIILVFHETHKEENGVRRPRCASCLGYIETAINERGLRPASEPALSATEMDTLCAHCLNCNGECSFGMDKILKTTAYSGDRDNTGLYHGPYIDRQSP